MTSFIKFDPPVIAHRGASGYAPENTFAAFKKAKELGVNWVEFDIQLTACNQIVVIHDHTLERTTNGKGQVIDCSWDYLRTLDAGSWFDTKFSDERIPKLGDLIEFLLANQLNANIELKPDVGQEMQLVQAMFDLMSERGLMGSPKFLFSSFSVRALQYLRELSHDCHIGLLLDKSSVNDLHFVSSLQSTSVNVNYRSLNQKKINAIKSLQNFVLCYTVNETNMASKLFQWGVDAVFSDFPDRVLSIHKSV